MFAELRAWGYIPRFSGPKNRSDVEQSGIDKLYMKDGIHVFQNGGQTNFYHISAYSGHTVVILMAIPRFFFFFFGGGGVEESSGAIIYTQKCTIAHMAVILLFKMAANPTNS